MFTLADYAVTPPDGKLYVIGGGVDRIFVPQIPGPLGQLWLAVRLSLPWSMTSDRFVLTVRILDADRHPVGQDPAIGAEFEVGRAPGQRPGDEIGFQLAIPITGFPVKSEGDIYFHLVLNDEELTSMPLKVLPRPGVPAQQP